MSGTVKEAVGLLEVLPESEQDFALEFIRKLVIAWDPDYTKLTPAEKASLEDALADKERVSHDEIDWD